MSLDDLFRKLQDGYTGDPAVFDCLGVQLAEKALDRACKTGDPEKIEMACRMYEEAFRDAGGMEPPPVPEPKSGQPQLKMFWTALDS